MAWINISRSQFKNRMLWAAVLRRAIFDYVLYKGVGKHRMKWQDAHAFLFGKQDTSPYGGLSFVEICGLFDWEPDYLRRKAKSLDRSKVKKLETLKVKEYFDDDTAEVFIQSARWECGQSVPVFSAYNYSAAYRDSLRLKSIKRIDQPIVTTTPFLVRWNLQAS